MNKLLELRGNFLSAPGRGGGATPTIPKGAVVQATHMRIILEQLRALREFWAQERYVDGALISVQYRDLVAKSNRLGRLLVQNVSLATEIVGAKYREDNDTTKHVITYYLRMVALDGTIEELEHVAAVVEAEYGGRVTQEELEAINAGRGRLRGFVKTNFAQIIKDCYYAERFSLNQLEEEPQGDTLVSLYKTKVDPARLLARLGIQLPEVKRIDDYTFRVTPDELAL